MTVISLHSRRARQLWDDKIHWYKLTGKELDEADGVYIHWLHMKFSDYRRDCRGYQVRISALGNGYSKWFGVNAYGSKAEAYKSAALYREFAMAQLPNPFPTKEQFIMWMIRRSDRPRQPLRMAR